MFNSSGAILQGQERSNWIRLRTLIFLRWVAIIGQLAAITVSQQMYNLQLEFGLCYLAIGVSVVGNLIAIFVFPENKRLNETENFMMVLFDLLQLSFLLYLTGGLNNPFAMLMLGPVTISASVLGLRSTILIGGGAIMLVTMLAVNHLPLVTESGEVLRLPDMFVFGNWAAITIATLFMGAYSRRVSSEMHSMSDALAATQMALAREQKLTDLGGVVAAAAHELGTPLATISLVAKEMGREPFDPASLRDDIALLRTQADRCREILRRLSTLGAGEEDRMALRTMIEEVIAPHREFGIRIASRIDEIDGSEPVCRRNPGILYGLGNLVENAVDFATEAVEIEMSWTPDKVRIRIIDDGPGFPPDVLERIGEPDLPLARLSERPRNGGGGLGLGIFIAKTLLERSGASVRFSNAFSSGKGANVTVEWPRQAMQLAA